MKGGYHDGAYQSLGAVTFSNKFEQFWGLSMKKNILLIVSAIFLSYLATPSWADGKQPRSIHGAYTAQLDLNPLGIERIEAFGFVLHTDGTVIASSEHEVDDLESVGIGVWKRLPRGQIGVGYFNFRIGTGGGCAAFGFFPPENCTLKLGATLDRAAGGGLVGNALLSFATTDGVVLLTIPVPLPFAMQRLSLEDFPGAMPSP